jgi:hypothetical protein
MRDMTFVKERYSRILDKVFVDLEFYEHFDGCGDNPEYALEDWNKYAQFEEVCGDECWLANGCSRIVIGDGYNDYVIKFQVPGCDIPYCADEVKIYEDAVRAGYGDKFAWCAKLMDYVCGKYTVPIYVYEYAECGYDEVSDKSYEYHYNAFCEQEGINPDDEESRDRWSEEDNCEYNSQEGMIEFAISLWGLLGNEGKRFRKFLYDHHVNDLHPGNWGYRGTELVLTDYSGYGEIDDRSCRF